MKSSQTPGPGEQEEPSPFANLPAYPEHGGYAASGAAGDGDVLVPGYGSARYKITQNKLLEKGLFSVFDDSGTLRFTVPGNWTVCDTSGDALAAVDRRTFGRQVDILRHGQVVASVRPVGLGAGEDYNIDGPAGRFAASGDFFGHRYTVTGPGGGMVATVTQQRGFRETLEVEIVSGQDDVLLLAVILAIEDTRDRKGNPPIT